MLDIKSILKTNEGNPLLEQYTLEFKALLSKYDISSFERIDNEILLFNRLLTCERCDEKIIYDDSKYKILDICTYAQLLQSGIFSKKPGSFLNEWFFKLYFPKIKKCIVIIDKNKKGIDNDIICVCKFNNKGFVTNLNNNEIDLSYTKIIRTKYFDNDQHLISIVNKIMDGIIK